MPCTPVVLGISAIREPFSGSTTMTLVARGNKEPLPGGIVREVVPAAVSAQDELVLKLILSIWCGTRQEENSTHQNHRRNNLFNHLYFLSISSFGAVNTNWSRLTADSRQPA